MSEFGKRGVRSGVSAANPTRAQPPIVAPLRGSKTEAINASLAIAIAGGGFFYLANTFVFDGLSTKFWFMQWWCILGSPFVGLYLYFKPLLDADRNA